MRSVITAAFLSALVLLGCGEKGDDDKKGDPLNAPLVKPPVERNSPSGLGLVDFRLEDSNTTPEARVLFEVQRYLKPTQADAVGALDRLDAIDDRMTELDSRVQDSTPRLCLENPAEDYTLAGALPNSDSFPLKLNCQENLDNGSGESLSAQLAFGLTDADFYIFERTGNSNNAVVAKAGMDATSTEFWQFGIDQGGINAGSTSYIHLYAKDGEGMEIATAGSGYSVFDCGMRMRSTDTLVYIEAYDFLSNGSEASCASELTVMCRNAADMTETDVADCTAAEITSFNLVQLTRAGVDDDAGKAIILTPITGLIDFTAEAEVPATEGADEGATFK